MSTRIKRLLVGFFFATFLLSISGNLVFTFFGSQASAATSVNATYVNFGEINVSSISGGFADQAGTYLLANKDGDDPHNLYYTKGGVTTDFGNTANCTPYITVVTDSNTADVKSITATHMNLTQRDGNGSAQCTQSFTVITIANTNIGYMTFFKWANSSRLSPVSVLPFRKEGGTFSNDYAKLRKFPDFIKQSNGNFTNAAENPPCASIVNNIGNGQTTATFNAWTQKNGTCDNSVRQDYAIHVSNPENFTIDGTSDAANVTCPITV